MVPTVFVSPLKRLPEAQPRTATTPQVHQHSRCSVQQRAHRLDRVRSLDVGFAIIKGQPHHICLHSRVHKPHRCNLATRLGSGARLASGQSSDGARPALVRDFRNKQRI